MKNTVKQYPSVKMGGLFLTNIAALGFFFAAASTTSAFFLLYLGYFVSTGAQVYERGVGSTFGDIKEFLSKIAV